MNIKRPPSFGAFGPVLSGLILFGMLCAVVAYWAITLLAPASPVAPVEVAGENRGKIDPRIIAELFGAAPSTTAVTATAAPSNIQVLGITAGDARGSAVLSVDGVARFYPIGAYLTDGAKLVAVKADTVVIERAGARSELPAPARPTLAVLSNGKGGGIAGAQAPGGAPRAGTLPATAATAATPPALPAMPLPPPPPFGAAAAGAVQQQANPANLPVQSNVQPPQPPAGAAFNPNIAPLLPGQVAPNMLNLPNQPAMPKAQ